MTTFMFIVEFIRRHRQLFSVTFVIAFVGLVAYYAYKNIDEFLSLAIDNWWLVGLVFIGVLVRNFSTGLVMDSVLRPLGLQLRIVESFGLANLTRLVNQLTPGNVGIVMRSMYLKRRHKLSYASFTSSFAASQIILYLLSSSLGIVAYCISIEDYTAPSIGLLYFLIGMTGGLLALVLVPKRFLSRVSNKRIRKAIEGWYFIRGDTKTVFRLSIWSLLFIISSTIIMYANFKALGYPISIWNALFFSSINMVNTFIAFTPAGFGISEGIIALLATTAGIPASVGLAVALLQRVITFFAVLVVAPYFSKKLFHLSLIQLLRSLTKRR